MHRKEERENEKDTKSAGVKRGNGRMKSFVWLRFKGPIGL